MLNLNSLGMAISLINHSHSYHNDNIRRKIFSMIDQKYMIFFGLFISYRCLKKTPNFWCFLRIFGNIFLISYIYFYLLEGYKQKARAVESYTEKQKYLHMLLHFVAIVGLTNSYKEYYIKNI
jgi:arginine exporter protein ArgO